MKKIALFFVLNTALIFSSLNSSAQNYVLDKTIAVPGDGGNDFVFIDQPTHQLYASHGTAVNVIDLQTEKVTGTISGMKGVHGIAIADDVNRGFISDGKANTMVVFDTKTLQVIKTISTGKDPHCIIYDPFSKKVFCFNGDSENVLIYDPQELKQVGSIPLGGEPETAVSDGNGLIYTNLENKSSLSVIDVKTLQVIKKYPLAPCGGPTGLTLDKENQRLFTVCRLNKGMSVVDINTGKVVQTLPIGSGVDAVIYDAANKVIVASNGDGTATVFKQNTADNYSLIQTLTTPYRAKTMAIDPATHKIYFPVSDYQGNTKNPLPGTFKILVYSIKPVAP
jgi:YVTN family beta-propeller protein